MQHQPARHRAVTEYFGNNERPNIHFFFYFVRIKCAIFMRKTELLNGM